MEKKVEIKPFLILGVFLIMLYLSFKIIEPFISALLASFILAYLFYPLYRKLNKITKKNYLAAIITIIGVIILFLIPTILISEILIKEVIHVAQNNQNITEQITEKLNTINGIETIIPFIESTAVKAVNLVAESVGSIAMNIGMMILNLFIIIFVVFYCFIYGEEFVKRITKLLPFKNKEKMVQHAADTTDSIIYGLFVLAIIEFILAAIGFLILKISAPISWAFLVGLAIFLPLVGPFLVLLPLMISHFIIGNYKTLIGLVALWLILSSLETFLKPKLIGDRMKINPVIILLGIFGGIGLFGIMGFIIGPILLSLTITLIEDYYYENIKD